MKHGTRIACALLPMALAFAAHAQAPVHTPAPPPPTDPAPVTGATVVRDAQGNPVGATSHLPTPPPPDLRSEFDRFDANRDGAIGRDEAASDKYLLRTFDELDASGDRRLDFEEMRAWLDD